VVPSILRNVVKTKIKPPRRRVGLLRRDRLIDFLIGNVNRKLLLISASPGYGKTTLLIDFIQESDLPTCWYAMDPSDSDPWYFITYLTAAIAETFPEMAGDPLAQLLEDASRERDLQAALQLLVNVIQEQIPEYFAILIDDFQFASSSNAILDMVNWFLDHQPDNCCLILASRVMPDLPYLQLTARQEIAGLGSEDLAFTPEEIQAYLAQNHSLEISIEEARQLALDTEGWITGILLGTHTIWKGLIRSVSAAKARDEQVFDYMAQEIFDQQPEPVKHFLKSTSVLDIMTPAFCDRLLSINSSEQMLADLEKANLFLLRLAGEEKAYRYHALFQDFLRKQFEPDDLDERSALQYRAGKLYLEQGDWEAALEFFLASGSDEQAIEIIEEHMEQLYRRGQLVTLTRWIDALNPDRVSNDPSLSVMRGRLYRQGGEFDKALNCYEQARCAYTERDDKSGELAVRIHEALVHQYSGAMETAKEMAEGALADADEDVNEPSMLAQAHRILGEYHHLAGELEHAKREFRLAQKLYAQAGDRYHESVLLQALGTTARRMGNPLEAEEHYMQALKILETLGNRWRMAELQNNIGMGYYYQGEYEKACAIFQQALQDAREAGHLHTESVVLASLGDLYTDLRQVGKAHQHFQAGLSGAKETNDVFLEVYCLCARANFYRVDEAWEHARSLLDQAGALSGEERSGYLQGLVALTRGMVAHDHGQFQEARAAFEDAISKLAAAGAQRELTRAHLWYANTLFHLEKSNDSYAQLEKAIELTRAIKHPHLLVVDSSRMTDLLEAAKSEAGIEGVEQLLVRTHQFNLSTIRDKRSGASPDVAPPVLEVLTLGVDVVKVNGEAIVHAAWKGPLVRELFFYLLENEPVRREIILDVFWPEYTTAKAQRVFHSSLYRMRKILPKGLIVYDNREGVYIIDKSIDQWYDARVFSEWFDQAEVGDDPEDTLEKAVSIYNGEYLPAIYSDWCLERRAVYQNMYVQALSRVAALKSAQGQHDGAISYYQQAVEVEPFQEALHRGLMQELADAGRSRDALLHYEELKKTLKEEMDLPPAVETTELSKRIQQGVKKAK
jgi:LuxR family maltose regulon positive regulatory protein